MLRIVSLAAIASMVALPATAVNMGLYAPSADVEAGFAAFLQELYAETEDPVSTTTFSDFFPATGELIVTTKTAIGADKIVALKQQLMPTDGSKIWNHVPNTTTVYSDSSATEKVYLVLGAIQTTFTGGNCSEAYYSTRFTVAKDASGAVDLTTHSGSLLKYDDYIVSPGTTPTDIVCQTLP